MAVEQITYKNIDPKVRNMIMVGLSFAMLVACFDGTIVGTCGPAIAEDLNGTSLYSWMVTAYMLCETIMIPISGKLSDLYGRKPLFLIGLTLFVVGSIFAGMSTSMEMLIACRAIQGLGGGILIPVATAAVADLYSPKDRARMQGILGAVFGIGSGIGPLIGGYITEYISWHWIFYINIPMALIAYALTIKKFPTPVYDEKPIIDVKGIAFLSIMLLDILLFFEWAGSKFDWVSAESFVMIAIALAMIMLFVTVERKAAEPILAPHLVHNKTVILACIFMFVFGLAMMGAMMYSSMFAISILGLNTLEAGEYSLALVAGMMITSMLSGNLVNKTGYKFWLIIGPIITALGLYMFSGMTVGTELSYYAICLFVFGIGLGCMMSVIMVAVQNSSEPSEMGMTTSAVNVIRSIGTTVGTAIFATLIGNRLGVELMNHVSEFTYEHIQHGTGVLDDLANAVQNVINGSLDPIDRSIFADMNNILLSFANSIDFAFLCGAVMMACLIIIGIFFKAQRAPEMPREIHFDDEPVSAATTAVFSSAQEQSVASHGSDGTSPEEERKSD